MFSTCLSVRSSRHHTCERDIVKTNEPNLLQIGTSVLWLKEMKWSTSGVRRSKIKGETTPKLHLEVWQMHSRPVWSSKFLPRDAMHKRGLCRQAVSMCVSVRLSRSWIMSKRINIPSKFFSPSGSQPF